MQQNSVLPPAQRVARLSRTRPRRPAHARRKLALRAAGAVGRKPPAADFIPRDAPLLRRRCERRLGTPNLDCGFLQSAKYNCCRLPAKSAPTPLLLSAGGL